MGEGMFRTTLSCNSTNDSFGRGLVGSCHCFPWAREDKEEEGLDVDRSQADLEEEGLEGFFPSLECRGSVDGEGGRVATIMS
jgi:hypothetical protein